MKRFLHCLAAAVLAFSVAAEAREHDLVVGYVPSWRDKVVDPALYNFDIYTHLNRAFLRPNDDGSLKIEDNYFNAAFEVAARAKGVKLLMSIGGEAKNPDRWLSIARDPQHVAKFLDTLEVLFRDHQYDGVDIDWEPPPRSAEEGQVYLGLLKAVRQRFPNKLLTVALSPKDYAVRFLPMADVMATIDYFNAMAYDFSGPWTGTATFSSNLYDNPAAKTQTSSANAIANLLKNYPVPPNKLVMGMTFWAYRFRVDELGGSFPKRVKGYADFIEVPRALDLMSTGKYSLRRDETADAAYLTRNDGGCVITFDDAQAIRDKTDFAKKLGLAGVMMWNAGADYTNGATPLLDAIADGFNLPKAKSDAAAVRETELLNRNPLPSTQPADVEKLNDELRQARALKDDAAWIAAAPTTAPATQP